MQAVQSNKENPQAISSLVGRGIQTTGVTLRDHSLVLHLSELREFFLQVFQTLLCRLAGVGQLPKALQHPTQQSSTETLNSEILLTP